jgi:hypothetical protein
MSYPIKPKDIKAGDRVTITATVTISDVFHHEDGGHGGTAPWSTIYYDGKDDESFSLEFPLHLESSEQATFAVNKA